MPVIQTPSRVTPVLDSIRSLFVLYGSVRSTPLARRVERSLLELPLGQGTILDHHMHHARACARRMGLEGFEMRVLVDTESPAPGGVEVEPDGGVSCVVQQDASPIRGVAGVLSDATREMGDEEYIIVSSGAQVYLEPLDELVQAMARKGADVALVSARDGSPVGVWLIRVGVLRSVKPVGYVDLKEQALTAWKSEHKVCVVERPRAYVQPARSLTEYLEAVRFVTKGREAGATIDEDPYREDWESTFSVVEAGAAVSTGAILHDSIALGGSSVGKGAVVVRSVLCPGSVVAPGARVTDRVLTGTVRKGRVR